MSLRIGIDARELQGRPTGIGRYLRSLLRAWRRDGRDRLFLYFNGPGPQGAAPDDPSAERRSLGARPVRGLWWQERLLPAAAAADRLDVFFSPAYVCPLRLALPRVTAVHDLSFFALPGDFGLLDGLRRRNMVRLSLLASDRILACSEFTRREIVERFPETAARVRHVPLGPDDDLPPGPPRHAARRALGVSGPLVLSVGSLFNRRRLPELLRAVALLAPRLPGLRLEVVGDNRTLPRLDPHRLAHRLGVAERTRFTGFVSEEGLALRYAAADVAVCLSDYEGFGLPALEAMARGVPVVVSDRPSLVEVFGEAALTTAARDPAQVAAAVASLLRDDALRRDAVARGRRLAAGFSWDLAARRTRAALAEAAGAEG